jgi:hypothetical protein
MEMSNLSNRVEKSKKLNYSHNAHEPALWSTWGSKSPDYGEKYYRISLDHTHEIVNTPDGKKKISVFLVDCQKDTGNGRPCNCPGNERRTVCYHGLGAVYRSFEVAKKLVSFFETYESAKCLSFGGKVAKVKSANGNGFVWCAVKDWPSKPDVKIKASKHQPNHYEDYYAKVGEILTAQENIDLMRGLENEEGID